MKITEIVYKTKDLEIKCELDKDADSPVDVFHFLFDLAEQANKIKKDDTQYHNPTGTWVYDRSNNT